MTVWKTQLALIETVYDQALQDPDQGPALHKEVRSRLRALRMVQASAPCMDADLRWERVAHLNAQGLRTPEDRRANAWAETSALQGVAEDFLPGDGQAPVTRLLRAQELLNHGRPEDREAALETLKGAARDAGEADDRTGYLALGMIAWTLAGLPAERLGPGEQLTAERRAAVERRLERARTYLDRAYSPRAAEVQTALDAFRDDGHNPARPLILHSDFA